MAPASLHTTTLIRTATATFIVLTMLSSAAPEAVSQTIPQATPTPTADQPDSAENPNGPELTEDSDAVNEPAPSSDQPGNPHASAKEKWKLFTDAAQGLATWNLFDDRVTVRVYTRFQGDGTSAKGSDEFEANYGELGSSLNLRRFNIYADGTIDKHIHYVFGYDFGKDRSFWNAYIEGIDSGLRVFGYNIGKFRVGFFQEPFGLERVTSSYHTGFLERSLPLQTFGPGNNVGYMVHGNAREKRMSWAAGFFSFGTKNDENASNSSLSVTTRFTGLPVWSENGRRLVHLGAAYSTRSPQSNSTRYHSRPEARFVDYFADTGDIDSGAIQLYGVEAAMVNGPLWLQSEFVHSNVESSEFGNLGFWGGYFQAGYFLTGEVRPYDRDEGLFTGVVPGDKYGGGVPFKKSNGGAFELTARLSNIDLEDKGIHGGEMLNFSFGFNWHMTGASKVMLGFVRSRFEEVGYANILQLRYQYRARPR